MYGRRTCSHLCQRFKAILDEEQKGFLFLLLKTVIDTLDAKGYEGIKLSMAFLSILASSKSGFPCILLPEKVIFQSFPLIQYFKW
jgi:hypothetical protein